MRILTVHYAAEHDENELRESFKTSERVAIADALAERWAGRKPGPKVNAGNISGNSEVGETRDLAAAKAGLGSGKTYEAAKRVVENGTTKLVEAMDAGTLSINRASQLAKLPLARFRKSSYILPYIEHQIKKPATD